jgi:hypothetical protein
MRGIAMRFMTATHIFTAEEAAGMEKRRLHAGIADFAVMVAKEAQLLDFMAAGVWEPSVDLTGAAMRAGFPHGEEPALAVVAVVDSMVAGVGGVRIQRRRIECL